MKPLIVLASLAPVLSLAANAYAGACVELDASKDGLDPGDQSAAVGLLEAALESQGVELSDSNCSDRYVVVHHKLGESVNVVLTGPEGKRRGKVQRVEELGGLYDQMARSLISGEPMEATNNTVTRDNVTAGQAAPRRVRADGLKYFRLGYGAIFGPELGGGPAIGGGYRYELDSFAVDGSFLNLVFDTDGDSGASGSLVRLAGLYYFDPMANSSPYVGAGISWGWAGVDTDEGTYTGTGMQAELLGGYEFLRASTIRMFVEGGLTLPLYSIDTDIPLIDSGEVESSYAPTVSLSFGIGWGG